MSRINDYLEARGCMLTGAVGKALQSFALPGERAPGGRFMVQPEGDVVLWYVRSTQGLNLGEPWKQAGTKPMRDGEVPVYKAHIRELDVRPGLAKLSFAPRPQFKLTVAPDSAVRDGAANILTSLGWRYVGRTGDIENWSDGKPGSQAGRLQVKNGVAKVWSHRRDPDMPAPWRRGLVLDNGAQSYIVTGQDLGLAGSVEVSRPTAPAPVQRQREEVSVELAEFVKGAWHAGIPAPQDHRHLTKSGVQLDAAGLRAFQDTPANREKHFAGDIIVPLFRPASDDARLALEVCGGQRLMKAVWQNTDKLMLKGSKPAGAFVPLPIPDSLLRPGAERLGNIEEWARQCDTSKPLVICEGVSTGLAIMQAAAGNVLCAISSNNLTDVARWAKQSGLAEQFDGVVIAADYDIASESGRLKSQAIVKAMEAALVVEGKVALAPAGSPIGCDARDILALADEGAVRRYVDEAVRPQEIMQRQDVFPMRREPEPEAELGR